MSLMALYYTWFHREPRKELSAPKIFDLRTIEAHHPVPAPPVAMVHSKLLQQAERNDSEIQRLEAEIREREEELRQRRVIGIAFNGALKELSADVVLQRPREDGGNATLSEVLQIAEARANGG